MFHVQERNFPLFTGQNVLMHVFTVDTYNRQLPNMDTPKVNMRVNLMYYGNSCFISNFLCYFFY